jgi:hypothetical protein
MGEEGVRFMNIEQLVRVGCVRCHRSKCPLLMVFSSLRSAPFTFLPEGVIIGFQNFARGSKVTKIFQSK